MTRSSGHLWLSIVAIRGRVLREQSYRCKHCGLWAHARTSVDPSGAIVARVVVGRDGVEGWRAVYDGPRFDGPCAAEGG